MVGSTRFFGSRGRSPAPAGTQAVGRADVERRVQLAVAEAQAYADERVAADRQQVDIALERRSLLAVAEAQAYADERAVALSREAGAEARAHADRRIDTITAENASREEVERRVQLAIAEAQAFAAGLVAPLVRNVDAFRQHVPGFLNAASSVAAFGYGLAELRRKVEDVVAAQEAERQQTAARSDELARVRDDVAALRVLLDGRLAEQRDGAERIAEAQRRELALLRQEVETAGPVSRGELDQFRRTLDETAARMVEDSSNLWRAATDANRGIGDLWKRLEFVRKEIMYEMKFGGGKAGAARERLTPRIVSAEKVNGLRTGGLKLNLGCGHVPLDGYVNIDQRDLPGVDVVADAGDLPFEPGSVETIFSAHMLEHFPKEHLRRLLPYWRTLLTPSGTFHAVVPDGEAMLAGVTSGTYSFEDFRMVLFGAQEYDGDFHYNLLTPSSLSEVLVEAGFAEPTIMARARKNDICFEFEIEAPRG